MTWLQRQITASLDSRVTSSGGQSGFRSARHDRDVTRTVTWPDLCIHCDWKKLRTDKMEEHCTHYGLPARSDNAIVARVISQVCQESKCKRPLCYRAKLSQIITNFVAFWPLTLEWENYHSKWRRIQSAESVQSTCWSGFCYKLTEKSASCEYNLCAAVQLQIRRSCNLLA